MLLTSHSSRRCFSCVSTKSWWLWLAKRKIQATNTVHKYKASARQNCHQSNRATRELHCNPANEIKMFSPNSEMMMSGIPRLPIFFRKSRPSTYKSTKSLNRTWMPHNLWAMLADRPLSIAICVCLLAIVSQVKFICNFLGSRAWLCSWNLRTTVLIFLYFIIAVVLCRIRLAAHVVEMCCWCPSEICDFSSVCCVRFGVKVKYTLSAQRATWWISTNNVFCCCLLAARRPTT